MNTKCPCYTYGQYQVYNHNFHDKVVNCMKVTELTLRIADRIVTVLTSKHQNHKLLVFLCKLGQFCFVDKFVTQYISMTSNKIHCCGIRKLYIVFEVTGLTQWLQCWRSNIKIFLLKIISLFLSNINIDNYIPYLQLTHPFMNLGNRVDNIQDRHVIKPGYLRHCLFHSFLN